MDGHERPLGKVAFAMGLESCKEATLWMKVFQVEETAGAEDLRWGLSSLRKEASAAGPALGGHLKGDQIGTNLESSASHDGVTGVSSERVAAKVFC